MNKILIGILLGSFAMLGADQYQYRTSNQTIVTTSDQELSRLIRDTLGDGWFSSGYKNVSFDVKDGVVTLRGTVPTLEDKTDVQNKVMNIEGVDRVVNEITVSESSE